jgi:TrmH family RNA methyltransferase
MTLDATRSQARTPTDANTALGAQESTATAAGQMNALVAAFRDARESDDLVVLEGFHPLKHALRFGASVGTIVTHDADELRRLAHEHAPELADQIEGAARLLTRKDFRRLGPYEPHTGVVSIARRVRYDADAILADSARSPVVLLDEPKHRGNFGAVIRVAAAAGAGGVLSTGGQDPWHPVVVRGAAGLQYALPVARLPGALDRAPGGRAVLAFDPAGEPLDPGRVPPRALLVFGSERRGVSAELLASADARLSLPMREGVSSLNLATTVAAVLYSLRLD